MIESIQYDEIKNKKRYFPLDINTSSKLYADKEIIYKFPYFLSKDLKQILEYVDQLNFKEFIKVLNLIYNKDELIGYSFQRYKNYRSLNKNKLRNFTLKKSDCYKIIKIYNTLAENYIECTDFHQGNVLLDYHTNDIKLCDLDSFCFSTHEDLKEIQIKKAFILSIAYLYNLKYCDVKNVFYDGGIYPNSFINRCIDNLDKLDIDMALALIDSLEYNSILQERRKIIVKSKQLSKLGYSKFNRF
ncbi:MAG: hypothetical protein IJ509_00950 [Bacilli bacterium]|nr:hypothetical protein [Bacilli bacterium]